MHARTVAIVVAGVAYVLGSHWLMTKAPESPWSVVGLLAPMLVVIALGAWRAGQRWLGAGSTLLLIALCASAASGNPVSPQWLYMAQHIGINLFLAFWFGSTLRPGVQPLISRLAARVHALTPGRALYTRHLTLAWTLFFIAIVSVSVLLFAFAPFDTWALFANVGTPVAVGAMFAGEYLLRYRLHPEFERSTIAQAVRAYMQDDGGKAAAATPQRDPAA